MLTYRIRLAPVVLRNLPQTNNAGLHSVMNGCCIIVVRRSKRRRANETHFSGEDIPKLRQLVQAKFSENPAYGSDSRVSFYLARFYPILSNFGVADQMPSKDHLTVHVHSPKLSDQEAPAISANALIREEDRTRRCRF